MEVLNEERPREGKISYSETMKEEDKDEESECRKEDGHDWRRNFRMRNEGIEGRVP